MTLKQRKGLRGEGLVEFGFGFMNGKPVENNHN